MSTCPHAPHIHPNISNMSLVWSLQALLARHEAYIDGSEAERNCMTARIEELEEDKRSLDIQNARTIEENRCLLDQLEGLNNAVADSDAHIEALSAALRSAEQELQRLGVLAARTESLEKQLAALEDDQAQLHESLATTAEGERTAVQRWRQAERTITSLNDQIDRVEREARQERERHAEVVDRMERLRTVEKDLETATGKLKDAAAARTIGRGNNGGSVVSHFVKDILQDNANLQLSIVELREMLLASNEEVEKLREHVVLHQSVGRTEDGNQPPTLQKELDLEPVRSQELHFHHHYHAPPSTADKIVPAMTQPHRRARKKRDSATAGCPTPLSGTATPGSPVSRPGPFTSVSTDTTLSRASIQKTRPYRWSAQSDSTAYSAATSSVPESPYSESHRTSSIFDRISSDSVIDSSRPTTPESDEPGSPAFAPTRRQTSTRALTRSWSNPPALPPRPGGSTTTTTALGPELDETEEIPNHESRVMNPGLPASDRAIAVKGNDGVTGSSALPLAERNIGNTNGCKRTPRHPLRRRAASHESVLSVADTDIYAPNPRPAQLLAPSTAPTSSGPVVSALTATAARPAMPRREANSGALSRFLLSGVAADQRKPARNKEGREKLGQKVGGWVWGKRAPARAPAARTVACPSGKSLRTDVSGADACAGPGSARRTTGPAGADDAAPRSVAKPRAPGVDQAGLALGTRREPAAPRSVHAVRLDEEALKESLGEG